MADDTTPSPPYDRQAARDFSKEHSQTYRDRLANDINSKRRDLEAKSSGATPSKTQWSADEANLKKVRLTAESKKAVADFYIENAALLNASIEDPQERDVVLNSIEQGVILLHGIPNEGSTLGGTDHNNNVLLNHELSAEERMAFALAVQPIISTFTKSPNTKDAFLNRGLIVGGGEITAADEEDLSSVAISLDERILKYSKASSSLMPNIKDRFKKAVTGAGRPRNYKKWNEVLVRRPEFSAIYVDDDGSYGQKDEFGRDKFYKNARWALEQSATLGLPAVVLKQNGQIFNLANDQEVGAEELLKNPVHFNLGERKEMLTNVGYGDSLNNPEDGITSRFEDLTKKFPVTDTQENYKLKNKSLAKEKLVALEENKQQGNQIIERQFGRPLMSAPVNNDVAARVHPIKKTLRQPLVKKLPPKTDVTSSVRVIPTNGNANRQTGSRLTVDEEFSATYSKAGIQPQNNLDQPIRKIETENYTDGEDETEQNDFYNSNITTSYRSTANTRGQKALKPAYTAVAKITGHAENKLQRLKITRVNAMVMWPSLTFWFFFQLPVALLNLVVFGGTVLFKDLTYISTSDGYVTRLLTGTFDTITDLLNELIGFNIDPTPLYHITSGAVFILGMIVIILISIVYTLSSVRFLFGSGAMIKITTFVFAIFCYLIPFFNIFPWHLLWMAAVYRYPK